MVDTLALGASAERREGSSPFIRTKLEPNDFETVCFKHLSHWGLFVI